MKRYARALLLLLPIAMFLKFAPSSRAEEFTCPVTKLVPITFEPVTLRNSRANLLGTEKLYTIFPGNWTLVQRTDRGYRIPKLIWGTNVVDLHDELNSSLTISGRRLDADSGPLVDWDTNTAYVDPANSTGFSGTKTPVAQVDKSNFAITSSFIVPALGCWEVTGHFHGEDLKVVIDVK
jgi:hypothetical protein